MSGVKALVRAPSNIALIKYMGKEDAATNLPANGSLSLTLSSLCTVAEVVRADASASSVLWKPELPRYDFSKLPHRARLPQLSDSGVARVIRHVERARAQLPAIFKRFGLESRTEGRFDVRSANTFPEASGIASSASSYAAITLAVAAACATDSRQFQEFYQSNLEFRRALASLSRQGSGSSCRSFEGPWVLWENSDAASLMASMPELVDLVLLIGAQPKLVSSSEAHARVKTSPLWAGRTERVELRLRALEAALGEGDLPMAARITWAEMWEMHSLFHTSAEPFTYWEPGSVGALRWLSQFFTQASKHGAAGPIVTMDAGANVHILVPAPQASDWEKLLRAEFPGLEILRDSQGKGAELLHLEKFA